jgi:hypothetical protein
LSTNADTLNPTVEESVCMCLCASGYFACRGGGSKQQQSCGLQRLPSLIMLSITSQWAFRLPKHASKQQGAAEEHARDEGFPTYNAISTPHTPTTSLLSLYRGCMHQFRFAELLEGLRAARAHRQGGERALPPLPDMDRYKYLCKTFERAAVGEKVLFSPPRPRDLTSVCVARTPTGTMAHEVQQLKKEVLRNR